MSQSAAVEPVPAESHQSKSYSQILRSTAVIGASYLATIFISMVRMKIVALFLGPAGIGLFGIYGLVIDLAVAIAGLGVVSSGVRQISEANGSGDRQRIGATVAAVNGMVLALGITGAIGLALLSMPVALVTFGDSVHVAAIALLGLAVLFKLIGASPMTVLQGLRRTRDLAMANVALTLAGALVTVAFIVAFGEAGIAPSLVAGAAAAYVVAWLYARRADVVRVPVLPAIRDQARPLLRLGFVFMVSTLLSVGSAYVIRIIILRTEGVHAAGLYQSAWALAALYAGFVLQAMGTDFYPRITEVAQDNQTCNRLVNEQARVSLLIAGPGVIGTIALAPIVLSVFYSQLFVEAQTLLRWLALGMMLRVVAWPMGYIVLAKGAERPFFWTEVAAALVQVGLAAVLVPWIGIDGAGLAFVGLYVWHTLIIYLVVRRLSGFRWSAGNTLLSIIYVAATVAALGAFRVFDFHIAAALGIVLAGATSIYSLREVVSLAPEVLPGWLRRPVLRLLRAQHSL